MIKTIIKPKPDFSRLKKVFLRQGEPDRIPFFELFVDIEIMEAILETKIVQEGQDARMVRKTAIKQTTDFYYAMGYDYSPVGVAVPYTYKRDSTDDTADFSRGQRSWQSETNGLISNWEDFEKYPWPAPESVDYGLFEQCREVLPGGMKMIAHPPSVLEPVTWIMGYEQLSYALADNPGLVSAMFEKVGSLFANIYKNVVEIEEVGAVWISDDMGFKTSTMISPDDLRKYVFPWYKKAVQMCHKKGLPVLLHSCGNLEKVIDDLIDDVGIDAKHSYEDAILPVTEAKKKYGKRWAILGGVDINVLSMASETEFRKYVRNVIEKCAPGGGYAIGSGNSVTNYVKLENYLAMLEEGWRFRY